MLGGFEPRFPVRRPFVRLRERVECVVECKNFRKRLRMLSKEPSILSALRNIFATLPEMIVTRISSGTTFHSQPTRGLDIIGVGLPSAQNAAWVSRRGNHQARMRLTK